MPNTTPDDDVAWDPDRAAELRREKRKGNPKRMRVWLIVGGLIAAVLSFIVTVRSDPPQPTDAASAMGGAEATGYLLGTWIGAGLMIGGVVFLVVYFFGTRRLTPGKGPMHFAVLALAAALGATPLSVFKFMIVQEHLAANVALTAIVEDYDDRSLDISDRDDRVRRRAEANARLVPAMIGQSGGLARARSALGEMRSMHDESWIEVEALQAEVETRIRALDIPERTRDESLELWAERRRQDQQVKASDERFLDLHERQLAVLARQPRGWEVQGAAILFYRDADMRDYNAIVEEARALRSEIAATERRNTEARARPSR